MEGVLKEEVVAYLSPHYSSHMENTYGRMK